MSQSKPTTETTPTPKTTKWRRALPWWAQIAILLVVFAAGGVVGAMVATKAIYSQMEYYRENTDALPREIVPRLQMRLGLTDEQTEKVREIIELRHSRMFENRRESAEAMLDEFDAMEREVATVLDDRQQGMWHAIAETVRRRFLPPAPGK